ncbi:DUF1254 domain-containing protein [Vibrio lamellibrachiae]|uniref:DUF1254 domain-containing protein n=1 Tax=Vibrio lamellibrachiae TaxID=2910253 RepID=UPI003D0DB03F
MKKLILAAMLTSTTFSVFASQSIEVTRDNYAQAESQKMMLMQEKRGEGVNQWFKYPGVPTLEQHAQIVRSNNDTVYSTAVIDTSEGATVTLPETDGRYISLLQVDGNHFTKPMNYGSGKYKVEGTTDHVFVIVRIGTIDGSPEDIAEINRLQKQLKIEANSSKAVPKKAFDAHTHEVVHKELQKEFAQMGGSYAGMFGTEKSVDMKLHPLGAATGWGGAMEQDAVYQMSKNFNSMECHAVTFEDPKDKYFWSITVYNKDIYVFSDNAHVSSTNAEQNDDGTYTVRFGCDGQANNITIDNPTGEWSPLMRHYGPSKAVLDKEFQPLLDIKPVK